MLTSDHPVFRHSLELATEDGWSGGLPLSSGRLGAMVWIDGPDLVISLDRPDLWDYRDIPEYNAESYTFARLLSLVGTGEMDQIAQEFEDPYKRPAPTKLPVGRLRFPGLGVGCQGTLSFANGLASLSAAGWSLEIVVHASEHCLAIRTEGEVPEPIVESPGYGSEGGKPVSGFLSMISAGRPEDLDYPSSEAIDISGVSGFAQTIHQGAYAVGAMRGVADASAIYVSVGLAGAPEQAGDVVVKDLSRISASKLSAHRKVHDTIWSERWGRGWLSLPKQAHREHYWVLDTYYLHAAADASAPPLALQGPWTFDGGSLPPWKGDYHHDLNTQMTYWPFYSAGRLEQASVLVDWLWETREACREWTGRFFGVPGLNVPMTADIRNKQLGGWAPYTHSLTTAAWLSQHMWLQWSYSQNRDQLRDVIAPWISEAATFLEAIMAVEGGVRRPPVSTSPEWNDNRREAFFSNWTTYDLVLTRYLFDAASKAAAELGDSDGEERWKRALDTCPELLTGSDGSLVIAGTLGDLTEWDQPHRHFSHALGIFPLQTLDPLDATDRVVIDATIDRIRAHGTDAWMGYTFGWLCCMEAQRGDANACLKALDVFDDGFRYPNGFHTNGDVSGKGYMKLPFDCFTLEGNSAALEGLQQMFLQSREDRIHLLPALPSDWTEASLHGFRARRGILVEKLSVNDDTLSVKLTAGEPYTGDLYVAGDFVDTLRLEQGESAKRTVRFR